MKNNKFHKIISSIAISAIIVCAFVCGGYFLSRSQSDTFKQNTTISGVDVGGLTLAQAQDKLNSFIDATAADITLDITYKDKIWSFNGSNFEVNSNIDKIVEQVYKKNRSGDFYQTMRTVKQIQDMGFTSSIALNYVFNGMEEKIDSIIAEIEQPSQDAQINFYPDSNPMFVVTPHQNEIKVNVEQLYDDINQALVVSKNAKVEVPVFEKQPQITQELATKATVKQSSFSTDYSKSSAERKSNIKLAFSKLNGFRVEPNQEFSFNQVVGERTVENGFKTAKVIIDGTYQNGIGGGVCQASTTLYNALIRAGVDISEVHKHTLPASYVPLAFDAMVSWGYADLKFTNTTNLPIFIKAYTDDNNVYVEIFGNTKQENETITPRAEFIGTLPHNGDQVLADTQGLYAYKIMFKGEYYRVKYPREGYESKAYLQYYKDGVLQQEKLIRHERYEPQQGLVYEGTEDLPEGMTLPNNTVNIIPPQTKVDNENVTERIDKQNPSNLNP